MASSGARRNPILNAAVTKNVKRPPDPEAALGSSFGGGGGPNAPVSNRFGCTPALVTLFFLMAGLALLFGLGLMTLDHRLRPLELQQRTAAKADGFVAGTSKPASVVSKRKSADASSVPEIDFNALLYGGNKPPTAAEINESGRNAAAAAVTSGLPGATALAVPPLPPNVRSNYYFFEVPEPDNYEEAERTGVRIPAADDKSIPDLWLDGLLHMSVCCRVDPNTQTCPNSNQIGVVIRAVPETGNHYLRVAVHNKAYYDVPCVFFWMSVNEAASAPAPDAPPRLPERQAPRKIK